MENNVVTSQPSLNSHDKSAITDQPPSYEDVISQQPKPSTFNHAVNDNEEILTMENGDQTAAAQLNSEQENKCENCKEQQKRKNRRHTDCCFVCYVDEPSWICCNLFSDCCVCLTDCTESSFECCADCFQNCCESNTAEQANNEDCCGDDCCGDDCCGDNCCGDDCCGDNCCGDDCNCDCSCFD